VDTDQGRIPIDQIQSGVHTIRGINIVLVTKTVTIDDHLVCFEKDSLGVNCPSERTIISKNHIIFHGDSYKQADDYMNYDTIHPVKYNGESLYNILLEKMDVMCVNNLICETLNVENPIVKLYTKLAPLNAEEEMAAIDNYNKGVMQVLKFMQALKV
jgi:hypothetical protein